MRYKDKIKWHVGISSSTLVMLDIDVKDRTRKDTYEWYARKLGSELSQRIRGPVDVIDSGKGFWLVGLRQVGSDLWRETYRWAQGRGEPFDQIHVEATLKWGRTTLRISRKGNGQAIKRVAIIDYPTVHT